MTRTLLVAAGVHTVDPDAPDGQRCVLVAGDRIEWVGTDPADAPAHDRAVDLGGAWITPAFVDAHVHATATGLARTGLDLAGTSSAAELLDRLRRFAAGPGEFILGNGWDDFRWPEGGPPTAAEVSAAAPGKTVLLTRVDSHSCLVDESLLARLPLESLEGVVRDATGAPTGWLLEAASEEALRWVRSLMPAAQLAAARMAACEAALELGIGSFHEMGHPGLSGLEDARAWAVGQWPVDVDTWWAELDLAAAVDNGLRPGGDLFLDGSIGSCTAATSQPYGAQGVRGQLFHPDDAIAQWFTASTQRGLGAGVHAIGDRAIEQALGAIEAAAAVYGVDTVHDCRHRIEHVELPTRDQVRRMARLGVVASVQPAFDAVWGGDDGLYAERFGVEAARVSNPISWFAQEGVVMAFGSDSTVTPLDPLGGIGAAVQHRGGCGIDAGLALSSATRHGHVVGQRDLVGRCREGWRADLAVWSSDPLRALGERRVRCLATLVRGVVAHGEI